MKRISLILTILLVLTLLVGASALAQGSDDAQENEPAIQRQYSPDENPLKMQTVESDSAIYIVVLDAPALPSYRGGIPGLPPTNPETRGERSLDANSPASLAYSEYLTTRREEVLERADKALGRHLDVRYVYEASLNGFAVRMTPAEAARLARVKDVRYVEEEQIFHPLTDVGPAWVGATDIWNGTATGGLPGTFGEGIIVGVIDTGIDPWNPSFADVGGDGYDHTNPYGSGVYVGVCDPNNTGGDGVVAYDSTFDCNDKLIGVWGYSDSDDNPRDSDGHGSHTASTTAGNFVDNTAIETDTATFVADISGVAPHANIIAYDGCSDGGGCPGSSLEKARDQAILDGVHVINYSIGSPAASGNPWEADSESESWLNVRAAGIFAATSAGNNGPGQNSIGSPGDLPWITSVGAASHNRTFLNSITLDDGSNPPLTIDGQSMTGALSTPAPVVLSKDFTLGGTVDPEDARLCAEGDANNPESPWPAGTFSGEIVVCERGVYGRVDKGKMVKEAGAGGYILAQPDEFGGGTGSLVADPHVLPAVHIDYYSYQDLLAYLDAAPGTVNGTIAGSTRAVNDAYGDIMASFSSRGPNSSDPLADILVPKVIAPGRSIWAAYHQGEGGDGDYTYNVIGGTSMSSPHVAGTGALMMALHPDWSAAEIESALMTTAAQGILNDDGVSQADPFDMGSGRVDLSKAGEAGLVLDVTTAEFQAANPDLDGDPKMLNLANLGNASCNSYCKWTRTVRNPTDTKMTWTSSYSGDGSVTITPDNLTLAPGATASFEVKVDVSGLTIDEWYFGDVVWAETGSAAPDAHLTLGVKARPPAPGIKLNPDSLTNIQPPNSQLDHALHVENIGTADLTWNIYEANAPAMASMAAPEAVTGIREVFWNQANNGNSGMPSTYETDNSHGTYIADDFIPEKNTQLTEVVTYGFMNDADLPDAELIEWYIYPDSGGAPAGYPEDGGGSEIWTFSALPTATGVDITSDNIGLDLEAAGAPIPNLMAGVTYWLVVFPHMDSSIDNWYWLQGTPQASHGWYMNLVDIPFPIWRDLDTMTGGAFSNVAFRLTGIRESVCDTPGDILWISSVTPSSATTGDEQTTAVAVTFDSSGLSTGDYEATLCVDSNDADRPLIEVPITLSVDSTCSEAAPVAVVVSTEQDGADVLLNWEDDSANKGGYQIHRSNSPYFTPHAGTKIGNPLPVGTTEYRDTGAVGNPSSNYFYIVQALNCDQSQTADSGRLAEFDFALAPGDTP